MKFGSLLEALYLVNRIVLLISLRQSREHFHSRLAFLENSTSLISQVILVHLLIFFTTASTFDSIRSEIPLKSLKLAIRSDSILQYRGMAQ